MDGDCVFQDDMIKILDNIENSDMLVFATPVFLINLKAVLSKAKTMFRFCKVLSHCVETVTLYISGELAVWVAVKVSLAGTAAFALNTNKEESMARTIITESTLLAFFIVLCLPPY